MRFLRCTPPKWSPCMCVTSIISNPAHYEWHQRQKKKTKVTHTQQERYVSAYMVRFNALPSLPVRHLHRAADVGWPCTHSVLPSNPNSAMALCICSSISSPPLSGSPVSIKIRRLPVPTTKQLVPLSVYGPVDCQKKDQKKEQNKTEASANIVTRHNRVRQRDC